MTTTVRLVAAALLLIAAVFAVWPADAATDTQIAILDNRYDPNDVAAQRDPRDGSARVTWSNIGANAHTVTSASGAWADSGELPPNTGPQPSKFVLTIQRDGIYNYFCRIHGANVMSGVVRIGPSPPPATTTTAAPPPPATTTTTIAPVTTTTAPPVTTTTATPESTTTSVEETTTTSSSSTTSTTEVALRDDDDDDDESNGPLRIVGVAALLAAAAGTVVQARRFLGAG